MKKAALLFMFLTILSKLFGFVRELILAYFFGASNVSDAYIISSTVPVIIFGVIGAGVTTAFIPMYTKIKNQHGDKEGIKFTNNIINIFLLISFSIFVIGEIFTTEIIKIFASGFTGETLKLTVLFTRISLIGMLFSCLIFVLTGFLQVNKNYSITALIGLPLNIIIIISIIVGAKVNVLILSIGSVLAIGAQLIILLHAAVKNGYQYSLRFNFRDANVQKLIYIALPVMIGVSMDQINALVDRTLASQIITGGVSALNYANKLNAFVQGIFVVSIITILFPRISKFVLEEKHAQLKKSVLNSLISIQLLVLPVVAFFIIFTEPIVNLLFGRGSFNEEAIRLTSEALFYYSFGILAIGFREVLSRVFLSFEDSRTPMINSSIAMVLNIVLNLILSRFMGIGGLALATSISAFFATFLMFYTLRKKIGSFDLKSLFLAFLKIIIAASIMGVISKVIFGKFTVYMSQNISLITSLIIGLLSYILMLYFMKIKIKDVF